MRKNTPKRIRQVFLSKAKVSLRLTMGFITTNYGFHYEKLVVTTCKCRLSDGCNTVRHCHNAQVRTFIKGFCSNRASRLPQDYLKITSRLPQDYLKVTSRLPQGLKVVLLRLADNASVMWRWMAYSCRDESPIHRVAKSLLLFQLLMTMTPMTPMTVGYFCHRYRKYTYYY